MSRPRREWWSFECVRRCSVRSLMRSVSSATWTSVLPVSFSPLPNCAISSRFRSWVTVMPAARLAASTRRSGDGAGALDVHGHLLHERFHAAEAPLAAEPLEEVEAQVLPVQVGLHVDDVGLDEHAAPRV